MSRHATNPKIRHLVSKAGRAGPHARPWTPRHAHKTPVPARTVLGEPTPTAATCGKESSQ